MATFDQLSAEQRAIIELVLKQGRSYEELAELLNLPKTRIRRLARQALIKLSPGSAAQVEQDWRGPVADYLLQQQSGTEAAATRDHLRRSESARAWSRSILDSLDHFYDPANQPTIPAGDGGAAFKLRPPKLRRDEREGEPAAPVRRPSEEVLRRRQLGGGVGLVLISALALLVWPVGLLAGNGSDDDGDKSASAKRAPAKPRIIGQLLLQPVNRTEGTGVAVIAARGKDRQLIVQARLPATASGEAYEVWLYDSNRRARSLGAQVTDREGMFQGAGPLPADFARFDYIDVSRERVDRNTRSHSGNSVLRGRIEEFAAPSPTAGDGQTTAPRGSGRP